MGLLSDSNSTPDAPSGNLRLSLLLVEDDEADAYVIGRALEDNPAVGKVTRARDGVEALSMVALGEVTPDLAFIDLHMPHMDGFSLLSALAGRQDVAFPLVVLTSSSSPSDAVRSRLRSAVRVVTKPDTVSEMYAVLKTTIEAVCRPEANARPGKTPDYLYMGDGRASLRRTRAEAQADAERPPPNRFR